MKKLLCLILVTLCIFATACKTDQSEDNTSYKTDVSVSTISEMILSKANISTLSVADEGWVALNIPIDLTLCESAEVYINTTGSSDLFGVFKATSPENADKLLNEAEEYLTELEENWMSEYLAEELPKIQNSVAQKNGLYVTFLILDDEARDASAKEIENMLKN